ncbi:hypothetical protein HK105_204596 [Polyrhizophydium stewartii]|uniref:Enoyl reductase (ER) domain-containing protein n=1 Tax=Polyrhizophydium stewartii TaxID=2732419 RepID=A0ABR4N8Q3_9FUNG
MSGKAVILNSFGAPNAVLQVVSAPRPTPGPKQVLVHVKLRPVNPADLFSVMGAYPGFAPKTFPATPGLEGYGVVAEVGAGVTRVKVGQRVSPFFDTISGHGSWQEFIVIDEQALALVPDNVSDESAAQLIVNPVTVVLMLKELKIPKGEFLLQSAAGSTLGRQVIQVTAAQGIKTINLVRRSAQIDELKALGADIVVSTEGLETADAIAKAILAATGGKYAYGAIECVGGVTTAAITMSVRHGGFVLVYGAMVGMEGTVHVPSFIFRDVTYKGFWLGGELARMTNQQIQAVTSEVFELMSKGIMVPNSGEIFPLDKVVGAVITSNAAARGGKILLGN